jgi:phosphate transport system permease protein
MTDTLAPVRSAPSTVRRLDIESPEAVLRIRRRYAAERRFRAYGLVALGITTLFLLTLFVEILRNGIPAFWQHSLVLDVPVKADVIDPDGKKDPAAIRAADYFPLTRDALDAVIPGIEGRQARRRLTGLLSTGATDELRNRLMADPSLIGQTVRTRLLLTDNADLYLKGMDTRIATRPGRGPATPSGTSGEITLLAASADFDEDLLAIKRHRAREAAALRTEADRLTRTGDPGQADRVKDLLAQASEIQARVDQPSLEEAMDDRMPSLLVAINGGLVKITRLGAGGITGDVLLPLRSTAEAKASDWQVVTYLTPQGSRKITDQEIAFLERLKADGKVERHFNVLFFTSGDSREPELAGIRGAIVGSALMLLVTLVLCLPIGVLAAVYLEEFAPKNRLTEIIEVNINNLAAVPSIVFGLLGLAMFLNFFGLPRSAPLVGGLVLALLVLPTIIIASRAAIKAVPPSIKEAALGVGASHQQAVFHHVLPLAMPGIMTGTIIGMAHALGETAPLLMIGMVAFIVDVPSSLTEAATVLPVQIFLWSDLPEPAFQTKTAAAIIVLLGFLFVMNGLAIWLRRKFERRW